MYKKWTEREKVLVTEYYCSGPMYPSIDHIVPMSKGGGHVWENVQVAHIICNTEKGDSCEAS